ncbi:MAG TPA: hypothetical protein VGF53_17625 [Pseudolabrys sp.]|jgi:sirohydrochlorin ferrochelatase
MSGVTDEYRKQAEACCKRAEASAKTADRAFWLLLAENWRKLAQALEDRPASEIQNGDAPVLLHAG